MSDRKYLLLVYEYGEDHPRVLDSYSRLEDLEADLPAVANANSNVKGLGIAKLTTQIMLKLRTVVDLERV
jgi:hypothetical protein